MGLFKRRRKIKVDGPIALDNVSGLEPGKGGPSIFAEELAGWRLSEPQAVLGLARGGGADPVNWTNRQPAMSIEIAAAHQHEVLRSRMANYTADQVARIMTTMIESANKYGLAREQLRQVDQQMVKFKIARDESFARVSGDVVEEELYHRRRSRIVQTCKWLLVAALVAGEVAISQTIFKTLLGIKGELAIALAIAVTLLVAVVPHFLAHGMKNGFTRYHRFDLEDAEDRADTGEDPPSSDELRDIRRKAHFENVTDVGLKIIAAVLGTFLVAFVVPLTLIRLRGDVAGGEIDWTKLAFLALTQLLFSGYFFLREWLDYSPASHDLYVKDKELDRERQRRGAVQRRLVRWRSKYGASSEELIFVVSQAIEWDRSISAEFVSTVYLGRHMMTEENPELAEFFYFAPVPYLGSPQDAQRVTSRFTLVSIHETDPPKGMAHAGPDPFDRVAWLRSINEMIRRYVDGAVTQGDAPEFDADVNWEVSRVPDKILEHILLYEFQLEPKYRRPVEFDSIATEDGPMEVRYRTDAELPGPEEEVDAGGSGGDEPDDESAARAPSSSSPPLPDDIFPPVNGSGSSNGNGSGAAAPTQRDSEDA